MEAKHVIKTLQTLEDLESYEIKFDCFEEEAVEKKYAKIQDADYQPRKRKRSCADDINTKRIRKDSDLRHNVDRGQPAKLRHKGIAQIRKTLSRTILSLMYQLDLSTLCLVRKTTYNDKYPTLSLTFEDSEIDKFNNIVLRYNDKSVHVRVENGDTCFIDTGITYPRLFVKENVVAKQTFTMNVFFDSFVRHELSHDHSSSNIEYLVIYTNERLDVTEENALQKGPAYRNFYPLQFENVNIEEASILQDFLFTNSDRSGRGFFAFSKDKTTREQLLNRLEFTPTVQKIIGEQNLSLKFQKKLKVAFVNKLIFVVNQPSREELKCILKSEIERSAVPDYITLQGMVLSELVDPEKGKIVKRKTTACSYVTQTTYEFDVFMSIAHSMFVHTNFNSMNFERQNSGITISYRGRQTYITPQLATDDCHYTDLFLPRFEFVINKHFALFAEKFQKDLRHFVIYTNVGLKLTPENRLQKRSIKKFYPMKFIRVNSEKKKFKVLRNCLCVDVNSLYQFAQEGKTRAKFLDLLELPHCLQGRLSDDEEKELKEDFLRKLIFAVDQPNSEILNTILRTNLDESNVPYDYEKLQEIVLRWTESDKLTPFAKTDMEKLLTNIEENRSSYKKTYKKEIKKIEFAKRIFHGHIGTPAFCEFLQFLVHGDGTNYLDVLEREGISLASVCSILCPAKVGVLQAFIDLYNVWFDANGNKSHYLRTLEKNGISLSTMTGILMRAATNAAKSFKGLFDLWFDGNGNKTFYLRTMEKEGVNLRSVSCILNQSATRAERNFLDLYYLWFDEKGNKTHYLKMLDEHGVKLAPMSGILSKTKHNAVKVFKGLFCLWFTSKGEKSHYLTTFENHNLNLTHITSILNGSRGKAVQLFKDLYDLWFDSEGNKSKYLKTLEENNVKLSTMTLILNTAATKAPKAFLELYGLWFDEDGNRTEYLTNLEKEDIPLSAVTNILKTSGVHAPIAFKSFYSTWLDAGGDKRQHLKDFITAGFTPKQLSKMLTSTRTSFGSVFRQLHKNCFGEENNLSHFLAEVELFTPQTLTTILYRAGIHICPTFKKLHEICFKKSGVRTTYLTNLIKHHKPHEIRDILHKKVRTDADL